MPRNRNLLRMLPTTVVALAAAVLVLSAEAWSSASAVACTSWSLAPEFNSDSGANPDDDGCGTVVWRYEWRDDATGTYSALDSFSSPFFHGAAGVAAWQPAGWLYPFVGVNQSDVDFTFGTGTWPQDAAVVHPEADHAAVVAWKSPIDGALSISAHVQDLDPNGGDGVHFAIEQGSATLAEGTVAATATDVGSVIFPASTDVNEGQVLRFVVDVGPDREQNWDTTRLDINISVTGPRSGPVIGIATPSDGDTYPVGHAVAAQYSCTDTRGIGMETCAGEDARGPVASGDPIDTSSPGTFTFKVTATNKAGTISTRTSTYTVVAGTGASDTTPPGILIATPADGATVRVGDVVLVDYGCQDSGSGIESCSADIADGSPLPTSNPGTFTFTVEASDQAGNVSSLSHGYTVLVAEAPVADTTRPEITITSPWDGEGVIVGGVLRADYRCDDAGSGIESCVGEDAVGPVASGGTIRTTTSGSYLFRVTATDKAGNRSKMFGHGYRVWDRTPPVVTITVPEDHAIYDQGDAVVANFGCVDDEPGSSGIDVCFGEDGRVLNRDLIDTSVVGSHVFRVLATDFDGNHTSRTHTFTVAERAAPTVKDVTSGLPLQTEVGVLGTINPNGSPTTYSFQYAPADVAFEQGSATPVRALPDVRFNIRVGRQLTGLTPGTKYHYRLNAINSRGMTVGAEQFFTTATQPPSNSARAILVGNPEPGRVLGVYNSVPWEPQGTVTLSYGWQRCSLVGSTDVCRTLTHATGDTYQVTQADVGSRLRAAITAQNAGGSEVQWTDEVAILKPHPPVLREQPSIGGDLDVNETVEANPGRWGGSPAPHLSYQWQRCTFEVLCSDIPGARQRRYQVQAADLSHRLQVVVVASNGSGTAYATSLRSERIKPDKDEVRRATITQSYLIAFGREPDAGELRHWSQWNFSLAELIRKHLAFIDGKENEAKAVVRAAYWQVYGQGGLRPLLRKQFAADWQAEMDRPRTYDDLVTDFARALARQARERIFFWDKSLQNAGVEQFVSRARSDYYENAKLWPKMKAGEALWNDVALSNDALHGAARTEYRGYGADGAASREGCFGGIGAGCKGTPFGQPIRVGLRLSGDTSFTTLDGREMGYIKLQTAVGSILHDTACRTFVDGNLCKQDAWNIIKSEFPFFKVLMPAAAEWNKAVANTLTGRRWAGQYGPYPEAERDLLIEGKSGDAISYSDDLRPSTNPPRYTEVRYPSGLFLGLLDYFGLVPFARSHHDLRATTRLAAPRGTRLDNSDRDFCESRQWLPPRLDLPGEQTCA